jgi:5-methylcytosine-specific restriction endonuclease McrA
MKPFEPTHMMADGVRPCGYKKIDHKDSHRSIESVSAHRKYRLENRDEIRSNQREYRLKNRNKLRSNQRKYYLENRDEIQAANSKYSHGYYKTSQGYAVHRVAGSRYAASERGAYCDPDFTNAILVGIFLATIHCDDCGKEMPNLKKRHIDHIRPIVFGGTHSEANIQILCVKCHKKKSSAERSMIVKLARMKYEELAA